MSEMHDWRDVHEFWFPPDLKGAGSDELAWIVRWWMAGGATPELSRFLPIVESARKGLLDDWCKTATGRLSLIIVLDQFTRGLFAGTPEAYSSDAAALLLAEEGLRVGHYDALSSYWEKGFFLMPLTHTEGPTHRQRLELVVSKATERLAEAPENLRSIFQFALGQTQGHLDVISRFGRFPHRNSVLNRPSTPEELAYIEKGDFVHTRTAKL
ncbi:DUF924 family protein [Tardiphaga sp. 862_B3_N4_1]|uniref:DUF924 family protein n=1 Tax=unclassified Tardiphaga TaxID=2631404 RepID=UPI003F262248